MLLGELPSSLRLAAAAARYAVDLAAAAAAFSQQAAPHAALGVSDSASAAARAAVVQFGLVVPDLCGFVGPRAIASTRRGFGASARSGARTCAAWRTRRRRARSSPPGRRRLRCSAARTLSRRGGARRAVQPPPARPRRRVGPRAIRARAHRQRGHARRVRPLRRGVRGRPRALAGRVPVRRALAAVRGPCGSPTSSPRSATRRSAGGGPGSKRRRIALAVVEVADSTPRRCRQPACLGNLYFCASVLFRRMGGF